MGNGILYLLLLVVLAFLVIEVVGCALGELPGYEYVEAGRAFVFPDDGQIVLVLKSGLYVLEAPLVNGCYHLAPPAAGEQYGRASVAWPVCPRKNR